jgi:hypothetical protein
VALLALASLLCTSVRALAAPPLKVVRYRGEQVMVPRSWAVYNLGEDPSICVRFDRHAVYLGRPSSQQRCPARAAGRTEAILLEPLGSRAANAANAQALPSGPGSMVRGAGGALLIATWRQDPATIATAVGARSLPAASPTHDEARMAPFAAGTGAAGALAAAGSGAASPGGEPASPGSIYTGSGFDACSAPSTAQMSAWRSSSVYRAVGIYIGGTNRACAQPSLSAQWVTEESAAGWHLVPIYVGPQAPGNSCGCVAISSGNASTQGRAAADDAVAKAQGLGLGLGNPLYFDMEAYQRGGRRSSAVLAFLAAWTAQLRRNGYKSGVYSSEDSGIADLVSKMGTGYTEPDEIWIANWNGVRSTSDSNVPSSDWSDHQRLHQYQGGHDETHGGVKLNIDGDYLDAATAAAGSTATAAAAPVASSPPTISGTPVEGQTLSEAHGSWSGAPTTYTYQWEDCAARGNHCVAIPGATAQTYVLRAADLGHRIRVTESASNLGGAGAPAVSNATPKVLSPTPLFWLYTAKGNVYNSAGTAWYGSPAGSGFHGSSITGMASTADGKGYWLVDRAGAVFAFGDATRASTTHPVHGVKGIVAAAGGGYWLYTAQGNVYNSAGTPWYGSPAGGGFRGSSITGMAATADGRGYWLVDAAGKVFAFGDAAKLPAVRHSYPISGIVAARHGGYWLYTARGTVYRSRGTALYGSPYARRFRGSSIKGMAASHDGRGYWLVDSSGAVFAFGDAPKLPAPAPAHPVAGIAG